MVVPGTKSRNSFLVGMRSMPELFVELRLLVPGTTLLRGVDRGAQFHDIGAAHVALDVAPDRVIAVAAVGQLAQRILGRPAEVDAPVHGAHEPRAIRAV